MWCLVVGRTKDAMPEQRKRLHCVAEIALSTTFLLASEVPAMQRLLGPAYTKNATPKSVSEGQSILARSLAHASGYQNHQNQKAGPSTDPAAAQDLIAVIDHSGLPWRDR